MGHRYAVYYVPPPESNFYKSGTNILGYDIRKESEVLSSCGPSLYHFGSAHFYGFHSTIRGTFKTDDLSIVIKGLSGISSCISQIKLKKSYLHSFNGSSFCIRFEFNKKLLQLHSEIVTLIDCHRILNYISSETKSILNSLTEKQKNMLEKYGDPRVLDAYIFHFTLANRVDSQKMLGRIRECINQAEVILLNQELLIDRIALVEQEKGNPYWRIHSEFLFNSN